MDRAMLCEDCIQDVPSTWLLQTDGEIDHTYCDIHANKRFGCNVEWRKELQSKGIVVPFVCFQRWPQS